MAAKNLMNCQQLKALPLSLMQEWVLELWADGRWMGVDPTDASDGRIWVAADRPEWRIEVEESREEGGMRLRRISLSSHSDGLGGTARLEGLRVRAVFHPFGPTDGVLVTVPMARFLPRRSWTEVARRAKEIPVDKEGNEFEDLGVAPDCGLGHVVFFHNAGPRTVQVFPLPESSSVRARVYGDTGRVCVEHHFEVDLLVEPGSSHTLGTWCLYDEPVEIESGMRLAARDHALAAGYEPPADRPAWAIDACILEVDLAECAGAAALAADLPRLQEMGFDTVYLMPWHKGKWSGYGTVDYWDMDPAKGTHEDLKRLCAAAHARGMRVLFDLLVNIVTEESPYLHSHPDWFYRDAMGQPVRHKTWPGYCLDPASPGFRDFLRDYCRRCVGELGADGFRVDAVAYRGGNWNPLPGLQPRDHAHAVFSLLGEIRADIRRLNPQAILMAECFGPAQVPVSDLVCYQWVGWLDWCLSRLLDGRLTGRDFQHLVADHYLSMPPGTWLTAYTHTHDTVAFEGRELDGDAVSAAFHSLALVSPGLMTFAGGWGMRARPAGEEERQHRRLSALRRQLGGVAADQLDFSSEGPECLFQAARPSRLGPIRVISNFTPHPQPMPGRGRMLYSRLGSLDSVLQPWDTVVQLEGS